MPGVSRRWFLRGALTASAVSILSACSPSAAPAPTVAPAAKPTNAPKPAAAAPTTAPAAKPTEAPKPAAAAPTQAPAQATKPATAAKPGAGPTAAELDARWAPIYEKAKVEGVLNWYASTNRDNAKPVLDAFAKKFPGIKVEHLRAGGEEIVQRAIAEAKAGRDTADAFETGSNLLYYAVEAGVLKKHDWPAYQRLEGARAPDGTWMGSRYILYGVMVNSDRVKKEEYPRTWEDLLAPRWSGGKIAVEETNDTWALSLIKSMGRDKALDYMRKLKAQQTVATNGNTQTAQQLAAGEFDAFAGAFAHSVISLKYDKKAPVDWASIEPIFIAPHGLGIAAKAPHPNAAQLFAEFAASDEGQKSYAAAGTTPASANVRPEQPELQIAGKQTFVSRLEWQPELTDALDQYRKIFVG